MEIGEDGRIEIVLCMYERPIPPQTPPPTGHGTTCSQMLDALLRALQRGELPALLSLTFTCLRVSNREAWRQNEIASNIEHARPWLKAYISWCVYVLRVGVCV